MAHSAVAEPTFEPRRGGRSAPSAAVVAARQLVAARRVLNETLPPMMISSPGLDLLLALFIAAEEGGVVTLRSLDTATAASPAVMLRWVGAFVQEGLVARDALTCALTARGLAVVHAALGGVMAAWQDTVSPGETRSTQ
jgi:hypothetical protein